MIRFHISTSLAIFARSCLNLEAVIEIIEKLFEVKFLHLLSESSGQIGYLPRIPGRT